MKIFGIFAKNKVDFVKMHLNTEEWQVEFGTKVNWSKGGVLDAWL